VVDDADCVAQLLDVVESVAGEQNGRSRGRDVSKDFLEHRCVHRVQPAERFVENQQLRTV
jgi:hypothetical protein